MGGCSAGVCTSSLLIRSSEKRTKALFSSSLISLDCTCAMTFPHMKAALTAGGMACAHEGALARNRETQTCVRIIWDIRGISHRGFPGRRVVCVHPRDDFHSGQRVSLALCLSSSILRPSRSTMGNALSAIGNAMTNPPANVRPHARPPTPPLHPSPLEHATLLLVLEPFLLVWNAGRRRPDPCSDGAGCVVNGRWESLEDV